jgi:Ca-activated chloride channel family protein
MADLIARTDRSLIRAAARSVRHVVVTVVAPVADRTAVRPPLDVAFVLDRSGSMHGEKIVLARDAILQGIAMLSPTDRFAVVAYDDEVDLVMEMSPAGPEARELAEARVREIDARGMTNLSGGWVAGCRELAERAENSRTARCLLMSDGRANEGITNTTQLELHARELQRRGVVTSTFGVGRDFDERLMSGLARAGGGNGYFIEHARQIGDLLTSELAESIEVVARRAQLSVVASAGVAVEVLSDFDAARNGDETVVALGNLVSGQSLSVVLSVTFPTGTEGETAAITIGAHADESALEAAPAELRWTFASHARNDAQPRDVAVDVQVARTYAARARREALDMNRAGDFDRARRLLERVARRIDSYAGQTQELRELAESLRRDAREFAERMDSMSAKMHHYGAHSALYSRAITGKAHRARYDAEAFAVTLHRGVPVFVSEGQRIALVTGTPESFGRGPLTLLGERLSVPPSRADLTAESLSQYLNTSIDVVIGGDILKRFECLLDLRPRRLVFSHGSLGCDGVSIRTPLRLDVPSAEVRVGNQTGLAFLDTGTRLSYIDPGAVAGAPVGREKDFFPLLGEFETDVYQVDIELAGLRLRGRFGVLPPALQQSLAALGAQWVIGNELLSEFPLLLDLKHSRIMIVQQQPSFFQVT